MRSVLREREREYVEEKVDTKEERVERPVVGEVNELSRVQEKRGVRADEEERTESAGCLACRWIGHNDWRRRAQAGVWTWKNRQRQSEETGREEVKEECSRQRSKGAREVLWRKGRR